MFLHSYLDSGWRGDYCKIYKVNITSRHLYVAGVEYNDTGSH